MAMTMMISVEQGWGYSRRFHFGCRVPKLELTLLSPPPLKNTFSFYIFFWLDFAEFDFKVTLFCRVLNLRGGWGCLTDQKSGRKVWHQNSRSHTVQTFFDACLQYSYFLFIYLFSIFRLWHGASMTCKVRGAPWWGCCKYGMCHL